jgi:hypothetical protein
MTSCDHWRVSWITEDESGEVLERLAEALYLEREYAASATHYERAYSAYRRERATMAAGRAARAVAWTTGNVLGEWAVQSGRTPVRRSRRRVRGVGISRRPVRHDRPRRGRAGPPRRGAGGGLRRRAAGPHGGRTLEPGGARARRGRPPLRSGDAGAAGRRAHPVRSISALSRSPGLPGPTTPRSRTARDARCWTSCSWTPPPRLAPRFGRGSPSRSWSSTAPASAASAATAGTARPSPSAPRWSSVRMGATRSWPVPWGPSSTTRSRGSCAATTPIGAGCPWTAASRPTSARSGGFAAWPTNDDLTLVIGGWPFAELEAD